MVADGSLGGRGEDGLGELGCLSEAGGQLDAAHGAVLVVGLLARTGEVTAHDALNGDGLGTTHQHGPASQVIAVLGELLGEIRGVDRHQMVWNNIGEFLKPEGRDAVEHLALEGNLVRQDVVESRDTVGCDHKQVVSSLIDIANLAAGIRTALHVGHVSHLLKDDCVALPAPRCPSTWAWRSLVFYCRG